MSPSIIELIDKELEQLQRVRAILAETETPNVVTEVAAALPGKRRGRPAGTKNLNSFIAPLDPIAKKRVRRAGSGVSASAAEPVMAKRVMSEEGKAKIAAAQKKRWASAKRAAKKAAREAESVAAAKKTAKPAPAKKAVAKKAPAKKAAPTKPPAAKKAVAKKVTAKKAVVNKAAAKTTPVNPASTTETSTTDAA